MPFLQNNIIKEACVETLAQAIAAEKNGADRIELCGRLDLGGITPSEKLITDCLTNLSIPIKVMIRPRGGNFVYSPEEIDSMISDIKMCVRLEVPEIVTGALSEDGLIDTNIMMSLSANVGTMPITFHKAIDELEDVKVGIEKLKEIPKVKYILSSGTAQTASQGRDTLIEMIDACGKDLTVIVAGKVTEQNISELHSAIKAKEYHGRLIVGRLPA